MNQQTYQTGGIYRTPNSAELRLSAAISANAANVAGLPNGAWALISPYGDFPSPDKSYVQRFTREQAHKILSSWNSITGTAARVFKNMMHGLVGKQSVPVWDGHPDSDKARWPKEKLIAEITALRVTENGLEGQITWNEKGMQSRTRGPLYPSPLWWHYPPSGVPAAVFPELLESVGLVPVPNISSVPAWTQNARCEGSEASFTINGYSVDLTSFAARQQALSDLVRHRMTENGLTYQQAFSECMQDPAFAPLIQAMQKPQAS